jgi:hypothetical protein
MNIKKFLYTENTISATLINGYYLWLAYEGSSNVCHLLKNSAFDPSVNYFTLNVTANKINQMWQDSTYLFLALNDSAKLGCRINKQNPINSQTYFTKPIGIVEEAIDLIMDTSFVYFLIPGTASGTNAKVLRFNKSATYIQTINLTGITNAQKIDIDSSGNLWVIVNTVPPKAVKIQYISGVYSFSTYIIT